ncbi:MAG: chemotaxis protein CheX [Clostridiales bacterium]
MENYQRILANNFLNGVSETILTMTGFDLDLYECEFLEKEYDISGIIFMSGFKNAAFNISISQREALILVSYMTGIEQDKLSDQEITDGIMEILNVSAGRAKSKIEDLEKKFKISTPMLIIGKELLFKIKNNIDFFEYRLGGNNVNIRIGIYYI